MFRNNGITVVSKNIDRTGDRFRLEDYQVVNGCQTSNIIFQMLHGDDQEPSDRESLEQKVAVPFRLIGSKHDDFVSSIIIGTNRQNTVKEEQFWALRPFMKSFEEFAKSVQDDEVIYFERRENQYRGQQIERVRIIQPSVMMKAIAASILFQPHRAARDYRGIISEYDKKLFKEDHDVRIYHAACFLHYRLEFLWRNSRIDSKHKTFRYYILCAVGLLVTQGQDVFSMKKQKVERVARGIVELGKDEDAMKEVTAKAVKIIHSKISEAGQSSNQEQIRDLIRSEGFSTEFRKKVLSAKYSVVTKYITSSRA